MTNILNSNHILIDIETSGLKRDSDFVACIGVLYVNKDNIISHIQWINKTTKEEKDNLINLLSFLKNFSHIYSFGGKTFDLPFIIASCTFHNLDYSIFNDIHSVDIRKPLSNLASTRLDLEKLFGFSRVCKSTGKELAKVCRLYESSGQNIYKSVISAHNLEELYSLLGMYEIYIALTNLKNATSSVPSNLTQNTEYTLFGFEFIFSFSYNFKVIYNNLCISWDKFSSIVLIKSTFLSLNLKRYLCPHKDYFYILSENQIVHKSIAQFIAKSNKRKVSKNECCIFKNALYTPLITSYKVSCNIWYDSSNNPFVSYGDITANILASQLLYLMLPSK